MITKIQVGIIAVVVVLAGVAVIATNKPKEEINTANEVEMAVKPTEEVKKTYKYLTWEDGAGFKFEYPDGIKINNHPEDDKNYANLTLTTADGEGKIEILMADNSYKSIDSWAGKEAIETTLGDKQGKKIVSPDKTTIGVIDGEVLVTISRSFTKNDVLEEAWGKITDSWQFVYPTPVVKQTDDGNLDDVLEEE
ncbi:MAG: hypothetical protein WCV93_05170 [Candidatus Shapirobacteria bacterium]|jgi:hypothetical protein